VRAPAGYYALDARYAHVLGAGSVLVCTACGGEAHVPGPRRDPAAYSTACEEWIEKHKPCAGTLEELKARAGEVDGGMKAAIRAKMGPRP
jgi:hypothetical protein